MDRVAVFVDAGYLFAQGAVALVGQKLPRAAVVLDHERAAETLARFAQGISGVDLLRVYWYDGTSTGPTAQHLALAHLPSVKIRLGFVNSSGQQKGVDSLIVTDMITLARNHAMSDAVLLSGDEDLRVGVQQAQEFGVRVHLLGIRPSRGSQSLFLLQEADSTHEWGPDVLASFLSCGPGSAVTPMSPTSPASHAATTPAAALDEVAAAIAQQIPVTELAALVEAIDQTGQLPREIDGRLLARGGSLLGGLLDSTQKKAVRAAFVQACRSLLGQ
jgi:uncharacterized LabA/DUF88 family protein